MLGLSSSGGGLFGRPVISKSGALFICAEAFQDDFRRSAYAQDEHPRPSSPI